MKTDIQTELTQALRSHEKVWENEENHFSQKHSVGFGGKTDPTIIGLLLENDELKRHFFVEVNGVLVFKLQDFRFSWTNTASIIPTQNTPIALA